MSKPFETPSYQRRLFNYLRWRTMDTIGVPDRLKEFPDDPKTGEGYCADEVMFEWETHGKTLSPCWQPRKLYSYQSGKSIRDFYVSNWMKDVKEGLFVAEEFICTGGMDIEEFHNVFKRYPDAWLLRRMWRGEGMLKEVLVVRKPAQSEGVKEKLLRFLLPVVIFVGGIAGVLFVLNEILKKLGGE